MPRFSENKSAAAERAARAYLENASTTRSTRASAGTRISISNMATLHNAPLSLTKKYLSLMKKGQLLPTAQGQSIQQGRTALTPAEERAIVTHAQSVENTPWQLTEACIINKANYLRRLQFKEPISNRWLSRFKKRHPELAFQKGRYKEISRLGAEANPQEIKAWFEEYKAFIDKFNIKPDNLWNFDESPLQLGWAKAAVRIVSIRKKKSNRPVIFQPGNKESLTTIDAINAAGRAIPSFLILTAKCLLEEYAFADINEDVVLTHTETGFNNAERAIQWLHHFNRKSFKLSDSFKGHTITSWFGYPDDISMIKWERGEEKPLFVVRTTPTISRLLLMDGFSAHEDPEFIWYCNMFDIIPFRLPAHTSHILQPLDVAVFEQVKKAQQNHLSDWTKGGGMQFTRFDFLSAWNKIYKSAFRVGYIISGFENAGLWPYDPDKVLLSLESAIREREKPLWPKRMQEAVSTPRSAKRKLAGIPNRKIPLQLREIIEDTITALDYSILSQQTVQDHLQLAKARLEAQSNRTKTQRRITGVRDGAHTIGELREKVRIRTDKEQKQLLAQQRRTLKELSRQLRAEGLEDSQPKPRPRGRAAAAAKARQQAMCQEHISQVTPEERALQEMYQARWDNADDDERGSMSTTLPLDILNAIDGYSERRERLSSESQLQSQLQQEEEASHDIDLPTLHDTIDDLYLSIAVTSSVLAGSDSSLEIITARSMQQNWASDIPKSSDKDNEEAPEEINSISAGVGEEYRDLLIHEPWSEGGDEDHTIDVGGTQIQVPKTRARP